MPQFDFFVFPRLTFIVASLAVFVAFFAIFYVLIDSWVTACVILLLKVDLINSTFEFTNLINYKEDDVKSVGKILVIGDLLEQFILRGDSLLYFFRFLIAYVLPLLIVMYALNKFMLLASNFVFSVMKDVAQHEVVNFSRDFVGVYVIFFVVLLSNLVGVLPFSYTVTSSLSAPFLFSLTVLFVYFYILIARHKLRLLAGFLPTGTNLFIAPLITIIEFISTFAKFFSLGIRLFANMFAGHLLLKVFYSISFQLFVTFNSTFFFFTESVISTFVLFITSLEVMIALLQSFVIMLLTIIYLKEAYSFIAH